VTGGEVLPIALLGIQIGATLALVGVIWHTQLVQYPLFAAVERGAFPEFHARYVRAISKIVAPLMTIELATAGVFLFLRPPGIPAAVAWAGAALVAAIWTSTALRQLPLHEKLAAGFDERAHAALVRGNWLRTAAWSARAALLLGAAAAEMAAAATGPAPRAAAGA
jgi:hypothetical protein